MVDNTSSYMSFEAIANRRVRGVKCLSVTLLEPLEVLEAAEDAGVPEREQEREGRKEDAATDLPSSPSNVDI
jgi:hypothetical protein